MEVLAAWVQTTTKKFDENLVTKWKMAKKRKSAALHFSTAAASLARGKRLPSSRCVRRPMEIKWKMKERQVQHSSSFFYRLDKHSQKGWPFSFVSCQHPPLDGASEPIILRGEGCGGMGDELFKIFNFFKN